MKYSYYFIVYIQNTDQLRINSTIINEHPFKWMKDQENTVLLNWQKVSKREYDMYVGIL